MLMSKEEENSYMYICPKCGDFNWYDIDDECDSCDLPVEKLIKTNYTYGTYFKMTKEQKKDWEQKMRERYVLSPDNPYYDKDAYYEREDFDYQSELSFERMEKESREKQQIQQQSTQTTCPKCGSTSFTPVRRKWSFLTGFMTNKVDMVCNNCGYTVKKG